MNPMTIITPSHARDFPLCRMLHESVLAFAPPSTVHCIVTPDRDLRLFSSLRGERCVVIPESQLLPRRFRPIPGRNLYLNALRPFPPIRGWVIQQIIKLAAAARIADRTLVLADSDIAFIRPFSADTFHRDGILRLYRTAGAVDARLPRHLAWHRVARRLIGLPPASAPLPDYVSSLTAWDHEAVGALLRRIEEVNQRAWMDVIGSQLQFSEFILYGVFVDAILGAPFNSATTDTTMVLTHWDPVPLDAASAEAFVGGVRDEDIAIMISSKSNTPLDVRGAALESARARAGMTGSQGEAPSIRYR